ncbi:hypothetical protein AB4144_01465, partial [Rhizobiaceae sp. 2RAB30]
VCAKRHGAKNMAVVRHFDINLVRHAEEPVRKRSGLTRKTGKPPAPQKTSIKPRRKFSGWDLPAQNHVSLVSEPRIRRAAKSTAETNG